MHPWLVIAAALLVGGPAAAHERTISYSTWEIQGRTAHVTARLSRLDATRFPWGVAEDDELHRRLGTYLVAHLRLVAGGTPCTLADGPRALATTRGFLAAEWRLDCPVAGAHALHSDLLLDVAPTHLHFARVHVEGGGAEERVLSDAEREWIVTGDGASLAHYLRLGLEHILGGYDHLAFLLALLLVGGSLGEVARVVTGFTVGHSLTLAATVLGHVRPEPAPIEALIGLSIALVAAENVWLAGGRGRSLPALVAAALGLLAFGGAAGYGTVPALTLGGLALFTLCYFGLLGRLARPGRLRAAVALLFGLVHGFGFASALLEARLESTRLALALAGFNLGVEVGQLAVAALLWPALVLAARHAAAHRALVEVGSAAVGGLGVFWFVTRAYS
jgi:hypothetical protein